MKIPDRAPTLENLFACIADDKEAIFMKLLTVEYSDDRYFSYADLKRRPLPDFARNVDEWWLKILISRHGKFRTLPFTDSQGNPFQYFVDDVDWAILHDLDCQAGGMVGINAPFPNFQENRRYLVSSLMEEAIASSLLEGALTTREKAKEMLRQKRPPSGEGELMVLNNYNTMLKLKDWKNEDLSLDLIFRIHAAISDKTVKPGSEGRFRFKDENITVGDDFGNDFHIPPDADLLPERVQKLCDFANTSHDTSMFLHPIIKAIVLHFWLAYEHPFCDGNGRTARALFYWYLLKKGYWICEYLSISAAIRKSGLRYYKAFLNTEYNGNDLNYFIKFHIEILQRAVSEFLDYVEKKQREQNALKITYGGLDVLNSRQKNLLEFWLRHPYMIRKTDVAAYRGEFNVSRETARQDLEDLVKKKLALRKRDSRTFVFVAVENLEDFLKK